MIFNRVTQPILMQKLARQGCPNPKLAELHMMTPQIFFIANMCLKLTTMDIVVQHFIKDVTHGRIPINALWCQLLNGSIPLKTSHSSYSQQLVVLW